MFSYRFIFLIVLFSKSFDISLMFSYLAFLLGYLICKSSFFSNKVMFWIIELLHNFGQLLFLSGIRFRQLLEFLFLLYMWFQRICQGLLHFGFLFCLQRDHFWLVTYSSKVLGLGVFWHVLNVRRMWRVDLKHVIDALVNSFAEFFGIKNKLVLHLSHLSVIIVYVAFDSLASTLPRVNLLLYHQTLSFLVFLLFALQNLSQITFEYL